MTTTKIERVTKEFVNNAVDAGMDAQRQYSEELFSRADKRIKTQFEELEVRLKTALTTIRPEKTLDIEPVHTRMPYAANSNAECMAVLKSKMLGLVTQYEIATGLRVRCVYFEHMNGLTIVKPLVHNA